MKKMTGPFPIGTIVKFFYRKEEEALTDKERLLGLFDIQKNITLKNVCEFFQVISFKNDERLNKKVKKHTIKVYQDIETYMYVLEFKLEKEKTK